MHGGLLTWVWTKLGRPPIGSPAARLATKAPSDSTTSGTPVASECSLLGTMPRYSAWSALGQQGAGARPARGTHTASARSANGRRTDSDGKDGQLTRRSSHGQLARPARTAQLARPARGGHGPVGCDEEVKLRQGGLHLVVPNVGPVHHHKLVVARVNHVPVKLTHITRRLQVSARGCSTLR